MGGYAFLMENYRAGDKIILIGFSRGAYTARALAGMLRKVGLLPRSMPEQIPFAYELYKDNTRKGYKLSQGFKHTFSIEVKIEFMGVWDTVSSVGLIVPRKLPFTSNNYVVKVFRHALSLDERRAKFKPNVWHWPSKCDEDSKKNKQRAHLWDLGSWSEEVASGVSSEHVKRKSGEVKKDENGDPRKKVTGYSDQWDMRGKPNNQSGPPSNVVEVWFAGCHCDVGGGVVKDSTQYSLSNLSLRWMVKECIEAQCGVLFDAAGLRAIGIQPQIFSSDPNQLKLVIPAEAKRPEASGSSTDEGHTSDEGDDEPKKRHIGELTLSPSQDGIREEIELRETIDALAPIHDELKMSWVWWLLEIIPIVRTWQDKDAKWHRKVQVNRGHGRTIPESTKPPKVHISVQTRMRTNPNYKPRAMWGGEPEWVQ